MTCLPRRRASLVHLVGLISSSSALPGRDSSQFCHRWFHLGRNTSPLRKVPRVIALSDSVDAVIGVDTHRDTLAAAALNAVGGVLAHIEVPADARGYRRLFEFADCHAPGARCWAVEGASNYGAGLTAFLTAQTERVVEVAVRNDHHEPAPARVTRSTRSARPEKHSAVNTSSTRGGAVSERLCGS